MRQRTRRIAAVAFAAGLAASAAVIGTRGALAAPQASPAASRSFYLSLGGDDAVGAQPNAAGHNVTTRAGYASQLFTAPRRRSVTRRAVPVPDGLG